MPSIKVFNYSKVLDYFYLFLLTLFLILPIATFFYGQKVPGKVSKPVLDLYPTTPSEDTPGSVSVTLVEDPAGPHTVGDSVIVKLLLKSSPNLNLQSFSLGLFNVSVLLDKRLDINDKRWLHNGDYFISHLQKGSSSVGDFEEYSAFRMAGIDADSIVPFTIPPNSSYNLDSGFPYLSFTVSSSEPGKYLVKLKPADENYTPVISSGSDSAINLFNTQSLQNVLEIVFTDSSEGSPPESPACGDGNPQDGEACDDGNLVDGDGCSALCEVEDEEGSTPDSPTHSACVNNACVQVPGEGPNECSISDECKEPQEPEIDISEAKNLKFKIKLEAREENSQLKNFNPTVFVGLWRPSEEKFVISQVVDVPDSGERIVESFFATVPPKNSDVLVIKPESYLSKAFSLNDRRNYIFEGVSDSVVDTLVLVDPTMYLAGDVIVDIGSFDIVNVRDYVFYRSYFGSGNTFNVYYLDYNGNGRVDIFDFGYYRNNLGKKGSSEKYGLNMVEQIEKAVRSKMYKVIPASNNE